MSNDAGATATAFSSASPCFLGPAKLAERRREPAIRMRKIRIRSNYLSCCFDGRIIITGVILGYRHLVHFNRYL